MTAASPAPANEYVPPQESEVEFDVLSESIAAEQVDNFPDQDLLDASTSAEAAATAEPPEKLRRSIIAQLAGLPLGETVVGLKKIKQERPDLFAVDPESGFLLCDPGVVELLRAPKAPPRPRSEAAGSHEPHEPAVGHRDHKEERRQRKLIGDFANFAEEMKAGETLDAQTFRNLLGILGAESAFDVLYQFRKEYRDTIPMPVVRSFLAEYLGEFVITQGELNFDNLGEAVPYLTDVKLQQALAEVIKRDCLRTYNKMHRQNPDQDDFDVIADYLGTIRTKIKALDNEDLLNVVNGVETYYLNVFDQRFPSNLVDSLSKGRPFPDLNQRINIYESMHQKRILIGDEPGMGKSASAILTKECVGSECAVIITPSSVLKEGVWQDYLSSKVAADGKQIGYFKPGQEPRVLIAENLAQLEQVRRSDYDYILISQERITDKYCRILKDLNFDMLIVDEAHNFKNIVEGKRAGELIGLAATLTDLNDHLILLTATPAPNKVVDIAMTLRLLYPDKFQDHENADIVHSIIHGDLLEIRNLLLPRMQLKRLADSDEVLPAEEHIVQVSLTDYEKEIYELLLDEWELDSKEKLRFLRQIVMNPEILDGTPGIRSAKVEAVRDSLRETFAEKEKVVMFVNSYVNGIIAGDKTIIPGLEVPDDVKLMIIHGETRDRERQKIMQRFREASERMLLVVSGQTVSVGVDLSTADEVLFYNEPWTETEKRQELGRSQRPGREGRLTSRTFVAIGTIEEGIHKYIALKNRAIEKLLYGVPLTEVEQSLVERSETSDEQALEVNPELAKYYISSIDRMNKIFGHVKERGEDYFKTFLAAHGREYATTYQDLTSRSYQANASRLAGTLIDQLQEEAETLDIRKKLQILDIGSGPEMLRRHIPEALADAVTSVDINHNQLQNGEGSRAVAAMSHLPVADSSIDYANLTLAFHYTAWRPSKATYERLETLAELNRVLKTGGTAIITMPYSLDIRDDAGFKAVAEKLGFTLVERYSGMVNTGQHFKARVVTLKKTRDCTTNKKELISQVGEAAAHGLRFIARETHLQDSRRIATDYRINDSLTIAARLNATDKAVLEEEESLLAAMSGLRSSVASKQIKDIPPEQILSRGFSRIFNGHSHILFKRLTSGNGAVILRDN